MRDDSKEINIPNDTYTKLEKQFNHTQFENMDEYATFIFEELLHYSDEPGAGANIADQEELRQRLESLGYIQDE